MYIPMNQNETRRFKLPAPFDLEIIVKPFTGENETFYFEHMTAGNNIEDPLEKIKLVKKVFDHFVKGYVHPETGKEVLFNAGTELPSSHFGMDYINQFVHQISSINLLTADEKKT